MNRYSYKGPVMEFEQCVSNNWEGTTYASSEKKARSRSEERRVGKEC